jgi:large exoprotein involved in heme utilization and adhesion
VQINAPDIDPSRELVKLPINLTDPSQRIATGCAATARNNSFIVSGRGGLPENPNYTLRGQTLWDDLRNLSYPQKTEQRPQTTERKEKPKDTKQVPEEKIVEAQRWVVAADGKVELVAMVSNATPELRIPVCGGV